MKRILIIAIAAVMIISVVTGCGIKEKIERKAGEAIGEKMLEGIAGDDVNIDIDGENVVIEGTDGEKFEFGSGEWPKSELAKCVPEYDSGKVDSLFEASDSFQVSIIDTDEKYFSKYLEKIKRDFSENAFEAKSDGSVTYSGTDGKGHSILIFYEENGCVMTVNKEA